MPRGVPNSGKRQPRFTSSLEEAALAAGSVDVEDGADMSAEDEADALVAPDGELIAVLPAAAPVVAEVQPTPEQLEIKYLRDQLAKMSGKKDIEPVVEDLANPGDQGNILIHFLEDGFSALGQVWYRGQELEFEVGSQAYKDTFNRLGQSWLDLRGDEFAQVERFGKIMFRAGPWPGKSYADGRWEPMKEVGKDAHVKPPTEEQIAAAEKARLRRAAPRLPSLTS